MFLAFYVLVLSSLLILTQFNYYADAKLLSSNCSEADTYDIGSTIESNLFKLLSSLSADALSNSGFSSKSFGNIPNDVYGLVMCFNEYSTADCANCIQNITSLTTQPCSMSATATVWYDQCIMSYSSNNFLTVAEPYLPHCLYTVAKTLDEKTKTSVLEALEILSLTIPNTPELFSTELVNGTNNMSAFMQCTRDLSPEECYRCISDTMRYFSWCSDNGTVLGMRLVTRNCYIQYESYVIKASSYPKSLVPPPPSSDLLHTPSPPPPPPLALPNTLSPPPPPPPAGPPTGKILIISFTAGGGSFIVVAVLFGYCLWTKCRSSHKKTNDVGDACCRAALCWLCS